MPNIRRPDIKNVNDFVEELGMLPDGNEPSFNVTSPLEQWFFNVADKHDVFDTLLDGEDE